MDQHARRFTGFVLLAALHAAAFSTAADWQPAPGPLRTRFAADVSPERVHPEHPRPQLVRPQWLNLNGLWDYATAPAAQSAPERFAGQILVPFPYESSLSGVMKRLGDQEQLWYQRTFQVPREWAGQRVLLHFGAVDWEARVWVNGKAVGEHRGGYDPFSLDITAALHPGGDQQLRVAVSDPTDGSTQPRGKQVRRPEGIWYTPTTGIWQTVWLEAVPEVSIDRLRLVPDVDGGALEVMADLRGAATDGQIVVQVKEGEKVVATARGPAGKAVRAAVPQPKLWSPDSPFLYDLQVDLVRGGSVVDSVASYAGLRKIALGKDERGDLRLLLNNRPLFQFGPLDQGFWPDGLYTAPTDAALRYDIEVTRQLGFNMCRKHVKVEPDRWYYWCDKLGLLVWQDMPSGDRYIGANDPDIRRTPASAEQFETEWRRIIDALRNHPSIVMWVPFNEGWGQYDTARIAAWTRQYDPQRLVNSVSGWTDRGVGDVHDIHVYPGPGVPPREPSRAPVLGEFGGLGLPIRGHTWQNEKNWGYRSFTSAEELTDAYQNLVYRLRPLVHQQGLAAAVYTQTTDVEIEVNGLLTYDRAIIKMDPSATARTNRSVHSPPPQLTTVLADARQQPATWRYVTDRPPAGWEQATFDDRDWKSGPAGFGERSTPGSKVRTEWKTPDIWLRRTFQLPAGISPAQLRLMIHHDEDASIYINGQLVARVTGYTVDYVTYPLRATAAGAFRQGENTLAIHCHQTGGGQYIDVGLVAESAE
ncbi:MAG: glycoside hydrolase family 2 TIM barrel-domain containing protein [Pirellulales bacterium]